MFFLDFHIDNEINIYTPTSISISILICIRTYYIDISITIDIITNISQNSCIHTRVRRYLLHFNCVPEATSRNDVAKVLHMGATTVASYYHVLLAPVFEIGDLKKMQDVSDLAVLLLTWAHTSGYPLMPFRFGNILRIHYGALIHILIRESCSYIGPIYCYTHSRGDTQG